MTDHDDALKVAREFNHPGYVNYDFLEASCEKCDKLTSLILHERREAGIEALTSSLSRAWHINQIEFLQAELKRLEKEGG